MPQTGAVRDSQIEELLAVERRYDRALLSADIATLEGMLAEQFFLNDFMGGVVLRSELLRYLGTGELKFHSIEPHDLSAQHHGDTGLVTGWTEMKAELQETGSEVKSRFLHVYVKEAGTWRLHAAQGTVIPELD
jgi:ketosteroid isomerase-like protein